MPQVTAARHQHLLPLVIMEIVPPEDTSEAVGLVYTTCRTVFNSVGTAIVGVMIASSTVAGTTAPTLSAWNMSVWFVVITGVLGFIAALAIKKAKPLDERESAVTEEPLPGALLEAAPEGRS